MERLDDITISGSDDDGDLWFLAPGAPDAEEWVVTWVSAGQAPEVVKGSWKSPLSFPAKGAQIRSMLRKRKADDDRAYGWYVDYVCHLEIARPGSSELEVVFIGRPGPDVPMVPAPSVEPLVA